MTMQTFAEVWSRAVATHPDSTFLLFESAGGAVTQWTYAQFDGHVARVAGTLAARGVTPGSAVHVCLTNSPAFIALWLAAARLGAWVIPVDPASTPRDLSSQFARTRPTLGVCGSMRAGTYLPTARVHDVPTLVLSETCSDLAHGSPLLSEAPAGSFTPAPTDRLAVMFTSGTTSQPKGVVLTQRNYAHVAETMSRAAALESRHRWLVTLPLFHANAQYYCFAPAIAVGASVALTSRFSASGWVRSAHRLAATHASLFAAPIRMILARTPDDAPPVTLEHVWFAQSLGSDHHAAFGRLVGCLPRQLYGMTETVAIVTADDSQPPTSNLIGRAVGGREVRLVDRDTLAEVADGGPGMILVAGVPGDDLFLEYLDDAETTSRTLIHHDSRTWLTTGDLAARGATGALTFVGRADDVIKVAGENVSLTEVEATIAQAPGVLEAAVVARDDPMRDHVPVAYVVASNPLAPPDPHLLAEWAMGELPPQARPREWHVIAELPRTSVGKVRRFRLTDG